MELIYVTDLAAARDFYRRVLGLEVVGDVAVSGLEPQRRFVFVEGEPDSDAGDGAWFRIADARAEHERLAGLGAAFAGPLVVQSGMTSVLVKDPSGNVVQLWSAADAEPRQDDPAVVAAAEFAGSALNGGLVGAIENYSETFPDEIAEAVAGFRALGLSHVADLIDRATREYRRMRPNGCHDEISAADEALWDELDSEFDTHAEAVEQMTAELLG